MAGLGRAEPSQAKRRGEQHCSAPESCEYRPFGALGSVISFSDRRELLISPEQSHARSTSLHCVRRPMDLWLAGWLVAMGLLHFVYFDGNGTSLPSDVIDNWWSLCRVSNFNGP